ncbi:hypothetical protein TL16_g01545 [Triparma laevis f. inornata]|uniref:Rho-GAP domain-containing protein n=1 Tax=Triparma laevis f. inornata TaxID=1714386 RepID=A0A9W6ZG77_9STRA|nr:hypothetical protein TL16_g01545 [Triparma laevis f. inornata]
MVSCIVHRTITLDTGEKAWEALDGGCWATLKVYKEIVDGQSLLRLVALADSSPEVSMDENLILGGQWAPKDVDWVEFYKYSSMFPGGEGDQIYGLAFANVEQCAFTTSKISDILLSSYPDRESQEEEARPVSQRPVSLANTKRPGSAKNLMHASSNLSTGDGSEEDAHLQKIIQQQQQEIDHDKIMEDQRRVKSVRQLAQQFEPHGSDTTETRPMSGSLTKLIEQRPVSGASDRGAFGSMKKVPSYKNPPPPPPEDSPIVHAEGSFSLVPPSPSQAATHRVMPAANVSPVSPPAPEPSPVAPPPSSGHVVSRQGSGADLSVRVSSHKRPSGLLNSQSSGLTGLEINLNTSHEDSIKSLGNVGRKNSLASFTNVENAVLLATDPHQDDEKSMAEAAGVGGGEKDEGEEEEEEEEEERNEQSRTTGEGPSFSSVNATRQMKGLSVSTDNSIGLPTNVTKGVHVYYNEELAHYEGLPDGAEWKVMNKQFGIPLGAVPKRTVKGYDERVPAVLEMLKNYLVKNGGIDIVGIFRLAPDKDDCNWAKQQINEGEFEAVDDVNIVANLIKVFFRELPVSLLEQFRDEDICKIAEMQVGEGVLEAVERVCGENKTILSLIYWLFDLMSAVVQNEDNNKMSAKNMAIVMSPNLFSINSENPMVALTMSQKVADFCTVLLRSRLKVIHGYDCKNK